VELAGEVAIVTGASRGIGLGTARALSQRHALPVLESEAELSLVPFER
jgi:NAD(P)-dependent dehydrogenase (short-subunit alcohol dehydrogenase family)